MLDSLTPAQITDLLQTSGTLRARTADEHMAGGMPPAGSALSDAIVGRRLGVDGSKVPALRRDFLTAADEQIAAEAGHDA